MKYLYLIVTVIVLLVYAHPVSANGGPVDWTKTTPMDVTLF